MAKVFEIDFIMSSNEREKLETNLPPGVTVHYYLSGGAKTINGFLKASSWAKLFNTAVLVGYLKINIVFTDRN
jgi:hypothetical protein